MKCDVCEEINDVFMFYGFSYCKPCLLGILQNSIISSDDTRQALSKCIEDYCLCENILLSEVRLIDVMLDCFLWYEVHNFYIVYVKVCINNSIYEGFYEILEEDTSFENIVCKKALNDIKRIINV